MIVATDVKGTLSTGRMVHNVVTYLPRQRNVFARRTNAATLVTVLELTHGRFTGRIAGAITAAPVVVAPDYELATSAHALVWRVLKDTAR